MNRIDLHWAIVDTEFRLFGETDDAKKIFDADSRHHVLRDEDDTSVLGDCEYPVDDVIEVLRFDAQDYVQAD